MNPLFLVLATGAGLLLLLRNANKDVKTETSTSPFSGQFVNTSEGVKEQRLDTLYKRHAAQNGLSWFLVKAIAIVESGENPNAVNPADPSYGIMQVLCVGGKDGKPENRFNIDGWPVRKCSDLFDVETNLHLGCQILSWNQQQYGFKRGIAVYNRWKSRHDPAEGPFGNQGYVDKVLREYAAIKVSNGGMQV